MVADLSHSLGITGWGVLYLCEAAFVDADMEGTLRLLISGLGCTTGGDGLLLAA